MNRRSLILVPAAGLAVLGLGAAPASAQAPIFAIPSLVFREVSKTSTFAFVDNPPRSSNPRRPRFSPGDAFVISVPLTKDRRPRGSLHASCTITAASKDPNRAPALCYGVFSFREGQVAVIASLPNLDAKTTSGVVVGGTRAYAGARGTFTSVVSRQGTVDTIDFADD
jgi:hypothetical protein